MKEEIVKVPIIGEIKDKKVRLYKKKKGREGIIYIIKSGDFHKIGSAYNLENRLKGYATHNPNYKLIQAFRVLDCLGLEKHIHRKFSHKRVKNEWFKLTNPNLYIVQGICEKEALKFNIETLLPKDNLDRP